MPLPFSASLSNRIYLENRNQVLLEQAWPCLSAWGRRVRVVLPRTRVKKGLLKRHLPFLGVSFNLGCGNDSLRRMVYCRSCKNLADGSQLHTSRLHDHGLGPPNVRSPLVPPNSGQSKSEPSPYPTLHPVSSSSPIQQPARLFTQRLSVSFLFRL